MNYYERHIGDYLKDTAHLSLLEHGIYTRLLDVYYTRESALPDDQVARLIGARSKDEKDALQAVLQEFFKLREGMHVQDRCDREIARYSDKQTKARASAMAGVAARRERAGDVRSDRMTAARAKGTHTASEWTSLLAFCGGRCVKCGATDGICKDHIVPVYQGGSDSIDNLQPLCTSCNSAKGPETIDYRSSEWRASVQRSLSDRSAPSNQTPVSKPKRKGAKAPLSAELPTWMQALIDLWHEVLPELPGVEVMNADRQQAAKDFRDWVLTTNRRDGTPRATNDAEFLSWARDFFTRARASDFLMGRGPRSPDHQNWRCTFEYLLSAKGMQKVIEQTTSE